MRLILTALCLALFMFLAPASAQVESLWPTLAPGSTLYGHFVQQQYLKGLTAPLKSEGDFVVSPDQGIIWRNAEPIRSVTVITPAGARRTVADDAGRQLASARMPAFAHLYQTLDRAIVGDWSALRQDFAIDSTGDRRSWRVTLTPLRSSGPLGQRLASVILTGSSRIDAVTINRTTGDSTQVEFLNQTVANSPPNSADAHLLDDKAE